MRKMCRHVEKSNKRVIVESVKINVNPSFILPTREVLLSHLLAQMKTLVSKNSILDMNTILESLQKDRSNEELLELLQDECLLKQSLETLNLTTSWMQLQEKSQIKVNSEKDEIGEQLFLKVAAYDSQLCAQITGMLLELETSTLKRLMDHPENLSVAIAKARTEYMTFTHGSTNMLPSSPECDEQESSDCSDSNDKDVLAEQLFEILVNGYPKHAAKLTGMLLELDYRSLENLMASPSDLDHKVQLALQVLESSPVS